MKGILRMVKSYKYRAYPNKQQEELIQKTFKCCRFVYNYYLDKRIELYRNNNSSMRYYDCCKDLTNLKKDFEWLKEPDKCSLQNTLKDLDFAYEMFFNKYNGYPRHKKDNEHYNSYRTNFTHNNIRYENNKIKLPKLGWVKVKNNQIPEGRILNATITQVPSGKYFITLCCTNVEISPLERTNKCVGIDLGIKDFIITSDGVKYENPKYLKQSLDKLAKLQISMSRKVKGSNNWEKARIKLSKQYEKVSNQRRDYLNKVSTELIKKYDIIIIEDLDISNMILQNEYSSMRRSIGDVSWGIFISQLEYKADYYQKQIIKVDRYFASSQICNCCGEKYNGVKNLSVRKWICPNCHTELDRDINAAKNILREGLKQIA